jgi:hypothetical protein
MNFIIIWTILFVLVLASFLTQKVPLWIPVILYFVIVLVRVKEVVGDYKDSEKRRIRDEKVALEKKANEMAERGLAQSGQRIQEEERIKEDFNLEQRKEKRKLLVDLVNTLFLK